jgi:drug/metabolite transporter (DMT)-like permease
VSHLSFIFLCLVWGSSFILMERAGHAFGAIDVALGRAAGGAVALGLIWSISRRPFSLSRADLANISIASLVGLVMPLVVLAYCVARGHGHSYFGMLVALVPLATIFASVPMLGHWPTKRQWIGVLGGLVCIALLVEVGSQRGMSFGLVALALAAPVGYAIGNTLIRWKLSHIRSVPLTLMLLIAGTALLLPLEFLPSLVSEMHLSRPAAARDWPLAVESLAFLGVVSTGIAIWLFNQLIIDQGPLVASMVTYVFPLVAIGWGIYDGDQPSGLQIAAMVGALTMVALVQFGAAKPTSSADAASPGGGVPEFCPAQVAEALLESPGEPE